MLKRLAIVLYSAALLVPLLSALPCSAAHAEGLPKAALVLQWQPQAQFAGFYVARAKGFYREAGVDLTIIPGGPDVVASKLLASGRAQFATMFLATGIERRADGMPLVNLAQLVQHSALMLITRASSGIKSPADLSGRRVGLWDNEFGLQPRALFQRLGITPTIVPQSNTLSLFLLGGVDAASGMWYNEYHQLLASGLDPAEMTVFFYRDLGLNFPEDGIYALESTLKADPGLCRAVVEASLRGWKYAFEHPDEAIGLVLAEMRAAHLPTSTAHQRFMLARMRDVMLGRPQDPPRTPGRLEREDFARVVQALDAQGLLHSRPDFAQFARGPLQ
jgi:NitT/TauT family transport system substrate-binding protein